MTAIAELTKEQLAARRQALITELNSIGQAPLDTPEGHRREEVIADLRNANATLKQLNIDEARRSKSEADRKKAKGLAEHRANLQRAGVLPPDPQPTPNRPSQTPGEFVLWQATKLRQTLRRFKKPQPFTAEFLRVLCKFIDDQAHLLREEAEPHGDGFGPGEWHETWAEDAKHHGRDDMACTACGTDSTAGCIAGIEGSDP